MIRLSVTVLVLLAAGCGSDQDPALSGEVPRASSSSSSSSSSSTSAVPPPDAGACTGREPAGAADDLTMNISHGALRAGAAVTWVLTVTNGGEGEVELVFASGQDGDVILARDGEEVYRWSGEMVFTQALRCQALPPGATATYELPQPVLVVDPGDYQLRASLAAEPKPFDVATQVTVN
ncbi:MAG: BsuPI-related putative proteinase inhibitor [Actinomycetota bacterium]